MIMPNYSTKTRFFAVWQCSLQMLKVNYSPININSSKQFVNPINGTKFEEINSICVNATKFAFATDLIIFENFTAF